MTRPIASSALAHLRVLDLTRVRAGPTCCRILADFGADVIKIEAPPGVDPNEGISGARHGYDMINLHRNKRSISLNLKEGDGRAVFMRMLKTADIVVENYRPDVKERLAALGFKPVANTPAEFTARIKLEMEKWGKVVRDANLRIE